ncbi:MAG TPA: alpha/beta hydrolase [Herpetosiphonaceae bacterium]|nr:alpha/beta hydrolase [Herpetosiphonaceae bacterium]
MNLDAPLPADAAKIDIGGRSLALWRRGSGAPTVILEAGLGGTSADWSAVFDGIAAFTQVCSYDRAGLGHSDPAPTPRTAADLAADLAALLARAAIAPPYILVGHSLSGMHLRLFASQRPDRLDGLVLIDATHEDKYAAMKSVLSPELQDRFQAYLDDPTRNSEQIDVPASVRQLQSGRRPLPCTVAVLARGRADAPSDIWPSAQLQAIELESMRRFADEAASSVVRIAQHSGHFIQRDQPELVIGQIRDLVMAARTPAG